jgi:hypothetical protein
MNSPLRQILQDATNRNDCTEKLIQWREISYRQPGVITVELHDELLEKIKEQIPFRKGDRWCKSNDVDYNYFRKLKSGERWQIGAEAAKIFDKLGIKWLEFIACAHHRPYTPVWERSGELWECRICGEKKEGS